MFNKRRDEPSNGAGSSDIFRTRRKSFRQGASNHREKQQCRRRHKCSYPLARRKWKEPVEVPITMKQFTQGINKVVVSLQDNILQKDIVVDITDGIPFCNECKSNDCAHVGFAVCAEQLNLRSKLE